jgi:hypothetical protein
VNRKPAHLAARFKSQKEQEQDCPDQDFGHEQLTKAPAGAVYEQPPERDIAVVEIEVQSLPYRLNRTNSFQEGNHVKTRA